MFEIGETVIVITDKGVAYDGTIMARATGDNGGPPAYQVALQGRESQGQWHKACDVFVREETVEVEEDPNAIATFLKK